MSNAANTVPPSIRLNGQDFTVLPLNWKQLKERRSDIVVINGLKPNQGLFTEEQQDAIARVIHASLQRSRSDLGIEFVEEHLDLGNVGDMLKMVFGQAPKGQSGEA